MGHTVIGLYYRRDKRVTIRSRLLSAITGGYHSGGVPPLLAPDWKTGISQLSLNGRVEISAVDIFCLLVQMILVAIRLGARKLSV